MWDLVTVVTAEILKDFPLSYDIRRVLHASHAALLHCYLGI